MPPPHQFEFEIGLGGKECPVVLLGWAKVAQALHMLVDLSEQGLPVLGAEASALAEGTAVGPDPFTDVKAVELLRLEHLRGDVRELHLDSTLDRLLGAPAAELTSSFGRGLRVPAGVSGGLRGRRSRWSLRGRPEVGSAGFAPFVGGRLLAHHRERAQMQQPARCGISG